MAGEIIAAAIWLIVAIDAYAVIPGVAAVLMAGWTDSFGWAVFGAIAGWVLGVVLSVLAIVQMITHIVLAVQIGTA